MSETKLLASGVTKTGTYPAVSFASGSTVSFTASMQTTGEYSYAEFDVIDAAGNVVASGEVSGNAPPKVIENIKSASGSFALRVNEIRGGVLIVSCTSPVTDQVENKLYSGGGWVNKQIDIGNIGNNYNLRSQKAARLMRFTIASSFSKSAEAGFVVSDDAINKYNQRSTLKLTTQTALGGAVTKLMAGPVDISTSDNVSIVYWMPDTIPNSGSITLYLTSDATLNTLNNRIQAVYPLGGVAKPGWNIFTLRKSEFTTSGTPDLTSIKQLRLRVDQTSGTTYSVSFAEVLFGYSHRPTITLMMDDGYIEHYAKPGLPATPDGMDGGFYSYMKYRGLKGSVAVIGSKVGSSSGFGFLSENNLLEMYANGFDLVTHGEENLVTYFSNDAERFANIELNRDYLKSRNIASGADVYVYPEGAYTNSIASYLKDAGFLGARTLFGPTILSAVTQPMGPYLHDAYRIRSSTMGNRTFADMKAIIDRAIASGHSVILYGHLLRTTPPAGDIMITQYSEFTQLVDYVAGLVELDLVDCVTLSDLLKMVWNGDFSGLHVAQED